MNTHGSRRSKPALGLASMGILGVLLGCQEPPEHPPMTDTCAPGMVCFPGSSAQDPGGDDGDGEQPGAGGAAPEEVTGRVREVVDELFLSSIAYTGKATIAAEGERSGVVEAAYTGAGTFELENFKAADPLWLAVYPEADRGVVPTLSPIPLDATFDAVDLSVVREENLDVVFQLSSVTPERIEEAAQIILAFVDEDDSRVGVAGIGVSTPDAEFVSYANGGSWSDVDSATDATGVVMLANVDAPAFPGSRRRVYLAGAASGYIDVRVAAGAVSLVEIPVE